MLFEAGWQVGCTSSVFCAVGRATEDGRFVSDRRGRGMSEGGRETIIPNIKSYKAFRQESSFPWW